MQFKLPSAMAAILYNLINTEEDPFQSQYITA